MALNADGSVPQARLEFMRRHCSAQRELMVALLRGGMPVAAFAAMMPPRDYWLLYGASHAAARRGNVMQRARVRALFCDASPG